MAAYLKDVENKNADLTAEQIMKDKWNRVEKIEEPNPNQMPSAAPETNPRYNNKNWNNPADIDYCDPYAHVNRKQQHARPSPQGFVSTSSEENKTQGKSKGGKEKRKGKRTREEESPKKSYLQKLWCEANTPEGYTYYWHIHTNGKSFFYLFSLLCSSNALTSCSKNSVSTSTESVWEPPEEGFMSIAEQEEEAKEHAIQSEFLAQIEKEGEKEKLELLEEQRANAEREKLRELRKARDTHKKRDHDESNDEATSEHKEKIHEEEKIPYRRDYSVPEKPDPYGPWQTVQIM